MAEVQWGILGDTAQLGNTFLKAYEAGNTMRIAKGKESALAKYATDPEGAASELMQYDPESALVLQNRNAGNKAAADRRAVLGSYQADPKAARQQAMQAGDMDLVKVLQGLDEEQRAQAIERGQKTANIINRLGGLSYEQRKAAIQKMAPDLVSQLGYTPEQVASVDPTDDWINAKKLENANFEKVAEQYTLAPGSIRFDDQGRKIAEAPFAPSYQKVGEGETLIDASGGAGGRGGSVLDERAARDVVASILPNAVITSGTRTPERNAEVGGVPNSYHLRGQALDIKPPEGVSLQQFRQTLEARGVPVSELIDEGDHWHLAWGDNGGARVIAQGAEKPKARPATAAEKAAYQISANTPAMIMPDGTFKIIETPAGKPLPVALQNAEDKDYEKIDGHEVIADQLGGFVNQIQSGKLKLGPVSNRLAEARTYAGMASQEDANYNSFVSGMKKMRDDSLALANGTQTEGDAKRAWEQLFANMNDERVVTQRLKEIQAINARAVKFRQDQIDRRRTRNGAEPVFGTVQAPAAKTTRPPEKDPLGLFQK